jgi:hypothetical protein
MTAPAEGAVSMEPAPAGAASTRSSRRRRPGRGPLDGRLVLTTLGLAVALALFVSRWPLPSIGVMCLGLLVLAVVRCPVVAAYAMLGASPLVAGIERGALIPVLRPNEALVLALGGALVARALFIVASGGGWRLRLTRVDIAILLMAITSSVVPLVWMYARGREIATDDVLFALRLWNFYAVFLVVRSSVRGETQVSRCLGVCVATGVIVALVGIAQVLGILPSPLPYYSLPELAGDPLRATSTTGSSFAMADVLVFDLAIALGWLIRVRTYRRSLAAICVLFVFGIVASGQISGTIALLVGVAVVALVSGAVRELLVVAPVVPLAGVALRPVVMERLKFIDPASGVPRSWHGRLDNLRTYFWPELSSDFNYLLGVRPAARATGRYAWEGYVWIESGHTWLLWAGGIPFFVSYWLYLWVAGRAVFEPARRRPGPSGVAALAALSSLAVIAVLMTFDVHLTLRAAADLHFSLLALACVPATGLGADATRAS